MRLQAFYDQIRLDKPLIFLGCVRQIP